MFQAIVIGIVVITGICLPFLIIWLTYITLILNKNELIVPIILLCSMALIIVIMSFISFSLKIIC